METASYIGPDNLWRRAKAAILNSRQSKFPIGDDPWIKATIKAVEYIEQNAYVILTSVGMNTWELTLTLASERKIPVIVVLPGAKKDNQPVIDDITHRFRLVPASAGFIFIDTTGGRGGKAGWPVRDTTIIRQADILFPVSIRSDGNLDRVFTDYPGKICDEFIVPYQKSARPRPRYDSFNINPALRDCRWLIHFTRSAPCLWPDESDYDYYRAICRSGSEYCRSAIATLRHILTTGVIYGSSRYIRHGCPVVGFTRFSTEECRSLFRYRPRLVNPYFEPYGIAIRQEAAADLGIRPVRYGRPELYSKLPVAEKPYFQNMGGDGGRWKGENEWRFLGDFSFSRVPAEIGKVVVPTVSEAPPVRASTDLAILPLFI